MGKRLPSINGRYSIITIEYFGQTMRDLNLTEYDVICWDPSLYIDCKKIDIKSINGKMALCNLTTMSPNNARNMLYETIETLSLFKMFSRTDMLLICSAQVASTLGLNFDGDTVNIREVGE